MTRSELDDRISIWLSFYDQPDPPPAQSEFAEQIRSEFLREWQEKLLRNAALLEVPPELGMTDASAKLELAIRLSKAGDVSKIDEVARLLRAVQAALRL